MSEQWFTYPALAQHWGMSQDAARTRARRGNFPRRVNNRGQAEVQVDSSAPPMRVRPPRAGGQSQTGAPPAQPNAEAPSAATATALDALQSHIATLKEQVARAEAIAAERTQDATAAREQLASLTTEVLRITADLMAARQAAEARPRSWWARLVG